jgi:5-methylcytosine-specific restriction endonuclease McrA
MRVMCPVCNTEFSKDSPTSKYCSIQCRNTAGRKGSTCSRCGSHFQSGVKGRKLCDGCRESKCAAPGCNLSPSDSKTRFKSGYCNPHYGRFKSHGDPLAGNKSPTVLKALDHKDGTRTCSRCTERKSLSDYYKDKSATLGYRSYCKTCQKKGITANYKKDPEKKKSYQRQHRKINLGDVREQDRARYERDKDKRISLVENQLHIRRARRNQAPFEAGITRVALRKRDGDHCAYCKVEMNFARATGRKFSGTDATIEHRLPLSKGGKHLWNNVVLACRDCNMSKNQKTEEEFAEYQAEIFRLRNSSD